MAALAAHHLTLPSSLDLLDPATLAGLARLGILQGTSSLAEATGRSVLSLDWPELEQVLPERGLPRGVVEIASPVTKHGAMRGGATTIALAAVRAVHHDAVQPRSLGGAAVSTRAWCAWITESRAPPLYAPAVAAAGVDLERLLVVRPPLADLARTVVKVAASGAFDLVVVDALSGLDTSSSSAPGNGGGNGGRRSRTRVDGAVVVRKLALAAEEKGTTFLLLTNVFTARTVPWPVALRLEVERRPETIAIRVTKDRRGSSTSASQHVVRVAC